VSLGPAGPTLSANEALSAWGTATRPGSEGKPARLARRVQAGSRRKMPTAQSTISSRIVQPTKATTAATSSVDPPAVRAFELRIPSNGGDEDQCLQAFGEAGQRHARRECRRRVSRVRGCRS
jgi:hypothetical protein